MKVIILVGAARSGTKFLRDCLAASPDVAAVPFDVNYVWRYGFEDAPHDVLDPQKQTSATRSFIHRTVAKLSEASATDIVIEKTVSNTLRVPYVDAAFPDATYVHLIRDGRDVAESAMRQWIEPPQMRSLWTKLKSIPLANFRYVAWYGVNMIKGLLSSGRKAGNVWGPRYPGIEDDVARLSLSEVCALQWRHSVETAQRDLAAIDPARVLTIRYEDLIRDEGVIRSLAEDLNIPDPGAVVTKFVDTVLVSKGPPHWTSLAAQDQDTFDRVLGETLKKLNYT